MQPPLSEREETEVLFLFFIKRLIISMITALMLEEKVSVPFTF